MVRNKKQENTGTSKAVEQRSPYKKQSNPASTGGVGVYYEAKVQANYLWAMLSGFYTPLRQESRITRLQFQAKIDGYQTDDLVCELKDSVDHMSKALIQVKRSLAAIASDEKFKEAIIAAWLDFKNPEKFVHERDRIALIYDERLSPKMGGARALSGFARTSDDSKEFIKKATETGFSSNANRQALAAVSTIIAGITQEPPSQDEQHAFWRHLFFISHSIDDEESAEYAAAMNAIGWVLGAELAGQPGLVWSHLVEKCLTFNSTAATVSIDNIDSHLPPKWCPVLKDYREGRVSDSSSGIHLVDLLPELSSSQTSYPGYAQSNVDAALTVNRSSLLLQSEAVGLPSSRNSSANKLITAQLDAISEKLKNCHYQTALDSISTVGKDLHPFDDAQKARWYHQRGICSWHLGNEELAAADFLKAGKLDNDDEKIISARIRGLVLTNNPEQAIEEANIALERFPDSLPIVLSVLHAKITQNAQIDCSLIPATHRKETDVLQMLAWAAKQRGEWTTAIDLALTALDSKSVGFYTRNTALTIVIENIINGGGSLSYRILEAGSAEQLKKVTAAFEPWAEHLWPVQSSLVVADTAAYLGYAFLMLNEAEMALRVAQDAHAHNLSCPNLLRVELDALNRLGRYPEYWEKASQYIAKLDDENLISIAQNAANEGRLELVEKAIETVDSENPTLSKMLIALRWLALVNSGEPAKAKEEVLSYDLTQETDLHLLSMAARIYLEEKEEASAEVVLNQLIRLASDKDRTESMLLADLLYDMRRYREALRHYERVLPKNQFSDWHVRLLRCYVKTDNRRKAKKLIEGFPAGWVENDNARFLAVELGQSAGDWSFVESVAKAELERCPEQASSWLLSLQTLVRLKPAVVVRDFLAKLPLELEGSIQQIVQISAQEIRYDLIDNGMQRLYRLHRKNLNSIESASAFFSVCLLLNTEKSSYMQDGLAIVQPGTCVELKDDSGKLWKVTIDPFGMDELSDAAEFISPSSENARRLIGAAAGKRVTLLGPVSTVLEVEVVSMSSAYLRLLILARDLATESPSPSSNFVSFSMKTRDDGDIDLDPILEQLQRHNAHTRKACELYENHPFTLGKFSELVGRSPVDAVRSWGPELPALFVSTGTPEERRMAAVSLANSEQAYVIDAATLTLLVNFECVSVLEGLPKVWVSSVSRDIIHAELEKARTEPSSHATMFEKDGKLGVVETTKEQHDSNLRQLEAIEHAIQSYCAVAPAYGLEQENEAIGKIQPVLTYEEHSVLLLAEEKDAYLFTVDGRFRRIASLASISGVWPQAVLAHMHNAGLLSAHAYSSAVLKMFYANHDFISLRAIDLVFMARQGKDWVNFGLRQFKKTISNPNIDFISAYDVCLEFMETLAFTGARLNVFVEVLKHLTIGLARHKDSPTNLVEELNSFIQRLLLPDPDEYCYPGAKEYQKQSILKSYGYALSGLKHAFELATNSEEVGFPKLNVLMCSPQPLLVMDDRTNN